MDIGWRLQIEPEVLVYLDPYFDFDFKFLYSLNKCEQKRRKNNNFLIIVIIWI